MIVVVVVTMSARDNLQNFLFIMLKLCLVPDVAYYARFSAHAPNMRMPRGERGRKGFRLQFLCVCAYKFLYMFAVDQLALAVKQVTVSHGEERNGERINKFYNFYCYKFA